MWRLKVIKWWEWLIISWSLLAACFATSRFAIITGGMSLGVWLCIYTNRVDVKKRKIKWDREEWE